MHYIAIYLDQDNETHLERCRSVKIFRLPDEYNKSGKARSLDKDKKIKDILYSVATLMKEIITGIFKVYRTGL